jgi:hypothetical protein
LIRLDKVHKFMKYEAPFGVACGHRRWSREGKKLVVLSSISEFQTIMTWRVEMPHPQIHETRVIKEPSEQVCGHCLRPHVKGKVKGAKGTRLNRFIV